MANRNMYAWLTDMIAAPKKKAMPILSFPGAQLLGVTVDQLVTSSNLQAHCMKAIAERYDMAAAVSLMDLSVEAEAFGCAVRYSVDEVPTVPTALIHDEDEAEALAVPAVGAGRTGICVEGIRKACAMITDRPVFAGMIGPYSLAGRMLDMTEIMILCYDEPEMVETILDKATQFLIEYAKAFKAAGADGVMLAEPAAGLLSPSLIEEFSNPYVARIREAVEDENFLVFYHNCGPINRIYDEIAAIDARAYSFGNAIDIEEALKVIPSDRVVIGNIDPAATLAQGTPELVRAQTLELLERCSKYPNFVIASGCDIPPAAPHENLEAFFNAVADFYA